MNSKVYTGWLAIKEIEAISDALGINIENLTLINKIFLPCCPDT